MRMRLTVTGALLALLLFGAADAGAATTFSDPVGDATGGAADITQVDVSNDAGGDVTIALTIPNRPAFTTDDVVVILLNTDRDANTGVSSVDYALIIGSDGVVLVRATGSTFTRAPQTTLRSADAGKTLTVNRGDIGDTTGFLFEVVSELDSNDDAEDTTDLWSYALNLRPVLETLEARFSPAKPKAGRPFRLARTTLRIEGGPIVKPDAITCVAALDGKRLTGRCSWRIPASARGKRLVVTLSARYKGARATFTPWRFRVG
jgi:hypothetical protein